MKTNRVALALEYMPSGFTKAKHGKQRREQKHVIDTTNQDDNNEKKRLSFEEYRSAENQLKSADAAGIIALIIFVIILAALMFGSGFAN